MHEKGWFVLHVMITYAAPGLFLRDDMHKLSKYLMHDRPSCSHPAPILYTRTIAIATTIVIATVVLSCRSRPTMYEFIHPHPHPRLAHVLFWSDLTFLDEDEITLSDSPEV